MANTWQAVYSHEELRCAARIAEAGFETFLPTYSRTVRWFNRTEHTTPQALFPGYLFAYIDFADLRQRAGLLSAGRTAHLIGEVTETEMTLMRLLAAHPERTQPIAYRPTPGDEVEIRYGAMAGLRGQVVRAEGALYAVVWMPTMMCGAKVRIRADWLTQYGRRRIGTLAQLLVCPQ